MASARPDLGERSLRPARDGDDGGMTTKIGFAIILAGVALICLRAANWVDSEMADIVSVLSIVVGALAVAIDGEEADQTTKPKHRDR